MTLAVAVPEGNLQQPSYSAFGAASSYSWQQGCMLHSDLSFEGPRCLLQRGAHSW